MSNDSERTQSIEGEGAPEPAVAGAGKRRLYSVIGIVLISMAVLLAVYGTVTYLALQQGQSLREENAQKALQEEIDKQMASAREDVDVGNFALALRRLEWILSRSPGHPGAESLQQEAQAGLNARLTPTPMPTFTPSPEPTFTPAGPDPAEAFSELEKLMEEEEWQEAVGAIAAFQAQFPSYQRPVTDAMLYDASVNLGLSLLQGDQVESGLFYLAQAERLGDLPSEAEDYRTWAELYLLGIGYYGVDWGTTIYFFRDLCAAAPYYQDSCAKLYDALVAYGDQFAVSQDWCPAQEYYAEASRLSNDGFVAEKLREARTGCLEATPTPGVPITGTLPVDSPPIGATAIIDNNG